MVQLLLKRVLACSIKRMLSRTVALLVLAIAPTMAFARAKKPTDVKVPVLLLDGGRKLVFERSVETERDFERRGFWTRVVDIVAGEPTMHALVRPYGVVTDSQDRIIVTDPGANGIHIFDVKHEKYKFISRKDKSKEPMLAPQCVAVDSQDNIYVTDSEAGKVFVFEPSGKLDHVIGSLKYDEGYFKRPTGIAVDSTAGRIYITDTLRHQIFMLDMEGHVLERFGKRGAGNGEFNFPTELRLDGPNLMVVDAMNFRIQVLNRSGQFQFALGKIGDGLGGLFRPKGLGIDSEGHFYVVEGLSGIVQVFNREGQLLYYFGKQGTGFGDFRLPAGLFIDHGDQVFVVDTFNRRVQVFRYFAIAAQSSGGSK